MSENNKGMGLLTAISAAGVLIGGGQLGQLQTLVEQKKTEELQRLYQTYLKNAIFNLNTEAQAAYNEKDKNPKYATAVLRILLDRLNKSGIKPIDLDETSDKQYASDTINFVSSKCEELLSGLSESDRKDVNDAAVEYNSWSNVNYYVENYSGFQSYKKDLQMSKSSIGCILPVVLLILSFIIFSTTIASGKIRDTGGFINYSCLSGFLLLAAIVWGLIANRNKMKAKKNVEEFTTFYDVNKLREIDDAHRSSLEDAKDKMRSLEGVISNLIGKMPSLA